MGKFKVGDRVRSISVPEAGIGIIEAIVKGGYCQVNFKDTWYKRCEDHESTLSLVVTATAAIVVSTHRGPAPRPFVHPNRASALAEADRLARKHPGDEFAVYERVEARVADVTVRAVA
jgi:hypothetical protein